MTAFEKGNESSPVNNWKKKMLSVEEGSPPIIMGMSGAAADRQHSLLTKIVCKSPSF